MKRHAFAWFAGSLFGVGLVVSGMTDPEKIKGFLDVAGGAWDPSLAFVMAGALAVHSVLYWQIIQRRAPLFAAEFNVPRARPIDARLITGAAIFGVGWGLAGYCPGPAIVAIASGRLATVTFVLSMLAGMAACLSASSYARTRQ